PRMRPDQPARVLPGRGFGLDTIGTSHKPHDCFDTTSMTLTDQILVEALAFANALWLPLRDPSADYWPATWVSRWRYAERGLPWRGRGDKEHERALGRAVDSGWLVRRRAARKTVGAKLTRLGLQEGWRLLGMGPGVDVMILEEVL